MIQPKRYSLVASYYCSDAKMEAFEDGEFVRQADYAALQAENERLDKSNTSLLGTIDIIDDRYGELQAENERLRKAGDAVLLVSKRMKDVVGDHHWTAGELEQAEQAWLAAKGVKS